MLTSHSSGGEQNNGAVAPPPPKPIHPTPWKSLLLAKNINRSVNSIEFDSHSHFGLKIIIKTQKTLCRLTTEEEKNPKHYVGLLFALPFNF